MFAAINIFLITHKPQPSQATAWALEEFAVQHNIGEATYPQEQNAD